MVGAFDTARAANPGITNWALTNALTQFHLSGSDGAALGGDLAYYYGKNGTLDQPSDRCDEAELEAAVSSLKQ